MQHRPAASVSLGTTTERLYRHPHTMEAEFAIMLIDFLTILKPAFARARRNYEGPTRDIGTKDSKKEESLSGLAAFRSLSKMRLDPPPHNLSPEEKTHQKKSCVKRQSDYERV